MAFKFIPISAQLMKDLDAVGQQDPYCVITVGDTTLKTKADKEGGKRPKWNETLDFECSEEVTEIRVKLYDKDVVHDDYIGEGVVTLE